MDRRLFLEKSMAVIISTWALSSCRSAGNSYRSQGGAYVFLEKKPGFTTIRILDLGTLKYTDIDVPLTNPHSAQRILSTKNEIIAFDFMGAAVKANPETGEVIRYPASDSVFMGHATQTNDGTIIWSTEMAKNGEFIVRGRSAKDFSPLAGDRYLFSGGHHIVKLPESPLMATTGYEKEKEIPFIRFYNRESGLSSIAGLPKDIFVSHLMPLSANEVVCITNRLRDQGSSSDWDAKHIVKTTNDTLNRFAAPLPAKKAVKRELDLAAPSPLVYASTTGETKVFWPDDKEQLFRFGFGIDSVPGHNRKFISSHTLSNTVAVWDGLQIENLIDVQAPMGVMATPDGKRILILSMGELKIYSLENRRFEEALKYDRPVLSISRYS